MRSRLCEMGEHCHYPERGLTPTTSARSGIRSARNPSRHGQPLLRSFRLRIISFCNRSKLERTKQPSRQSTEESHRMASIASFSERVARTASTIPKEVVEAVDAHENQHAKDEHTLSGF